MAINWKQERQGTEIDKAKLAPAEAFIDARIREQLSIDPKAKVFTVKSGDLSTALDGGKDEQTGEIKQGLTAGLKTLIARLYKKESRLILSADPDTGDMVFTKWTYTPKAKVSADGTPAPKGKPGRRGKKTGTVNAEVIGQAQTPAGQPVATA